MDPTVRKILKANYDDGVYSTHVSLISPKGKFQFNRQSLEEFWEAYCQYIHTTKDPIIGVAERPQAYLPILVDVDLKIRDNGDPVGETLYTEEQLVAVVAVYQSILRQIVDNCTDTDLTCVVLEKKIYQQTRNEIVYLKNGFHLHFPYIFLHRESQEVHLIPRVQKELTDLKLFANLGIQESGSVIDKSCCKVHWLLYGSKKTEDGEGYRVTKIYDGELNVISLDDAFKHYQIYDQKEKLIPIRGKIEFYLPRILSIVPHCRSTKEIKRGVVSLLKENMRKERQSNMSTVQKLSFEESIAEARRLIPMLADHRAESYDDWMRVGWILYNISDGHPDGLDLWCEFSSRCEDKYDEASCIHHWERMTKRDITLGTLRYYARHDNPAEFKKFNEERIDKHIMESLNGSHNDVAKALFSEYGDEFVCASITNRIWFQYINHRWEQIEDGVFLREKISGRIVDRYIDAVQKLYDEIRGCQDKAREAMINARIKLCQKMISNLKSAPYKNNVMKEACEVFYNPVFRDKLDSDPHLIAFKNGVYDLRQNKFRKGIPEDYLSKNMPINFLETYTEEDNTVQDVYTFLEQVFPDKSVRKYFLDVSSDVFVGGNHEKIVLFWTGEGDNGKSVTQLFFELMMGKLAIKLNTNVITGKKPSAGSAFADLARAGGGVRWAVLEEPDSDEMINTGIFKHLSGNDTFYARDLFEKGKDGREITPMFKLAFICLDGNSLISLPNGISIALKNLKENKTLLAWNNDNGMIPIIQQHLLDQGMKECIRLVLKDGRTVTCTPNHKFLTSEGQWINAEDIQTGKTSLKMTIQYPDCSDMIQDQTQTFEQKMKEMAFYRLLGYMSGNKISPYILTISNRHDTEQMSNDIKLVTGIQPTVTIMNGKYHMYVPEQLFLKIDQMFVHRIYEPNTANHSQFAPNCPLPVVRDLMGGLYGYSTRLPDNIFDPNTPTYLIREFLAGFFGQRGVPSTINKRNKITPLYCQGPQWNDFTTSLMNEYRRLKKLIKNRFGVAMETVDLGYSAMLTISDYSSIAKFSDEIGFRYNYQLSYRMTAISSAIKYKQTIVQQNQNIIQKTLELVKDGNKRKLAFEMALDSCPHIDDRYKVNYQQIHVHHLIHKQPYKTCSVDYVRYIQEANLENLLDGNFYHIYNDSEILPCYDMIVVGKESAGMTHVFDIVAEEPYSNFVAQGIVTHNCNKLPRIKAADKAVWNRVRVIPFESTFCRPDNPAPETYEEQLRQKRFPMDKQLSKKIPGLVEAFAWILLEHRKKIANSPRHEPDKVRAATEIYRKQNDIYRQFIEETITEDPNNTIALQELYNLFRDWFKDSLPGQSVPIKNEIEEYFTKIWGTPEVGKKWKGYRQRTLQDDLESGDAFIFPEEDLVQYDQSEPKSTGLPPM